MDNELGSSLLGQLADAYGPANASNGFLLVRESVFDTKAIRWVAAGCNSSGGGWLTRCKKGEVLAAECPDAIVAEMVNRLESALVRPEYDEDSAFLDGYVFFAMILRNDLRTRFRVSTARVDPRLMRLSGELFDLPREELLDLLCGASSCMGTR